MRVRVQAHAEAEKLHAQLVPVGPGAAGQPVEDPGPALLEDDRIGREAGARSWAARVGVNAAVTQARARARARRRSSTWAAGGRPGTAQKGRGRATGEPTQQAAPFLPVRTQDPSAAHPGSECRQETGTLFGACRATVEDRGRRADRGGADLAPVLGQGLSSSGRRVVSSRGIWEDDTDEAHRARGIHERCTVGGHG